MGGPHDSAHTAVASPASCVCRSSEVDRVPKRASETRRATRPTRVVAHFPPFVSHLSPLADASPAAAGPARFFEVPRDIRRSSHAPPRHAGLVSRRARLRDTGAGQISTGLVHESEGPAEEYRSAHA